MIYFILIAIIIYLVLVVSAILFELYTSSHDVSTDIWMLSDDLIHLVFFDFRHFF